MLLIGTLRVVLLPVSWPRATKVMIVSSYRWSICDMEPQKQLQCTNSTNNYTKTDSSSNIDTTTPAPLLTPPPPKYQHHRKHPLSHRRRRLLNQFQSPLRVGLPSLPGDRPPRRPGSVLPSRYKVNRDAGFRPSHGTIHVFCPENANVNSIPRILYKNVPRKFQACFKSVPR